ncbi:MAG: phosphoglycerate kinase [Thermoplasmata archaeon]
MDLKFYTLDDFDPAGRTVLLRLDINSPIDPTSGRILNDNRIRQHLVTLRELRDARVVIMAHQGRPGKDDFTTMETHADRLSYYLGREVRYVDSLFGRQALEAITALQPGEFLLLENTRFYSEEVVLQGVEPDKMASSRLVTTLGPHAELFINDAFAAAHRAQPSLVGFCERIPALAGRVMEREVRALDHALHGEARPKVAVFGGQKADDSLEVARRFLAEGIVDRVLTTGAVANLLLWASGTRPGKPSEEFLRREIPGVEAVVEEGARLLSKFGDRIGLPEDLILNVKGQRKAVTAADLPSEYPIYDVGLNTIVRYLDEIADAAVILMNGPAGVFEIEEFSVGTRELFLGVARAKGFKVVGGGHTVTAVEQLGIAHELDHVSTGGGSLIQYLAGRPLPVIEALERSRTKFRAPNPTR